MPSHLLEPQHLVHRGRGGTKRASESMKSRFSAALHRCQGAVLTRGPLDMRLRCRLALRDPQMSTRPVTPAKLADAHSVLFNGHSSGADVPGGSGTSVVLGWASRTRCDEALPDSAAKTIARGRAAPMPMHAFDGRAGGHLSNSNKGCSAEDERADLYRWLAHGRSALA